ncbi:MAG: c-type cytochrome [Gemmatimonadota bacterium]|nr:c-type cytochrome [Gemmatimonadota bacterium]MDH3424001.1 c-type cytochrome [Gemmatimonadota bacterium]
MARFRIHIRAALPLILIGAAACDATPPPVGMVRGAELYETCLPCHGESAVGNAEIEAPAIAGLPQWYIEEQLLGFQQSWRGGHFQDIAGMRMRPMAISLTREGDIESVAQYVAAFEPVYPSSTLHGNAGAGAAIYNAVCVTCHGPEGLGMPELHSPPVVQLDDWYLLTQLRNFRTGARGADPENVWGVTMRANTLALSDQAMQDVIAYIQTLR